MEDYLKRALCNTYKLANEAECVSLRRLVTYTNYNFVASIDSRRFVCKVICYFDAAGRSKVHEQLQLQCGAQRSCTSTSASIITPPGSQDYFHHLDELSVISGLNGAIGAYVTVSAFIDGPLLYELIMERGITNAELHSLACQLAKIHTTLTKFEAPLTPVLENADVTMADLWDLRYCHLLPPLPSGSGEEVSAAVARTLAEFKRVLLPLYAEAESATANKHVVGKGLRRGWIHGDVNDHNVLIQADGSLVFVDWDDFRYSYIIHDVAICLSYAMMHVDNPMRIACTFLRAYAEYYPLRQEEVRALMLLVRARLATSLCMSAIALQTAESDKHRAYITVHRAPALELLLRLEKMGDCAETLLTSCGYLRPDAHSHVTYNSNPTLPPQQLAISRSVMLALTWLGNTGQLSRIMDQPTAGHPASAAGRVASDTTAHFPSSPSWPPGSAPIVYDFTGRNSAKSWSVGDAPAASDASSGPRLGWGKYAENRTIYASENFKSADGDLDARTIHMGVDLEAAAGAPVYAALAGRVHSCARNLYDLDYGPCIILEHSVRITIDPSSCDGSYHEEAWYHQSTSSDGPTTVCCTFYTLYGHLTMSSILTEEGESRLKPGDFIKAGDIVGWVGAPHVNGGWPPHLHLQVNCEMNHGGWWGDYPGVCSRRDWPAYRLLCLDANLLVRCPWIEPVGWNPTDPAVASIAGVQVSSHPE